MRTYSHVLLTHRAFRRLGPQAATSAALGAALPDLPALAGAAWLAANRRGRFSREGFETEVCGRSLFAQPDAALHAAPPVLTALALHGLLRAKRRGARTATRTATRTAALFFLLGWAGHVAADALTHATDARPVLWPISTHRFASPVSYRERNHHAVPFTLVEHAAVLAAVRKMAASR